MTRLSLRQIQLHIRLKMQHGSLMQIVGSCLFLGGLAAWGWGVPFFKQQVSDVQHRTQQARAQLNQLPTAIATDALSPSEQRLKEFYANAGDPHYAEQQVATLIALAAKNNVNMAQTDYKWTENKQGNFRAYTVTIPIKGQYSMIRRFCDDVLSAIPFASLDEVSFKRAAISNQVVETRVRFTLFFTDENGQEGRVFTLPSKQGSVE